MAHNICTAFLIVVFLFGGSSRNDAKINILLVPVTFLFLMSAVMTARIEKLQPHRRIFIFFIVSAAIIGFYLVPVPADIWSAAPGHRRFADTAVEAGVAVGWRPLSMVPHLTWLSLISLTTPLTALLLVASTERRQETLAMMFLVLGCTSGLLGMLQILGPSGGPLYFYRITNVDSAVGLFANRNHQAALLACLFPIIALLGSQPERDGRKLRFRNSMLVGLAGALVPLVLITGSRAGVVLSTIGIAWAAMIYSAPNARAVRGEDVAKRRFLIGGVAVYGLGMTFLAIILARAEAIERLLDDDVGGTSRTGIWALTIKQASDFFPFGTGFGNFAEMIKVVETDEMLSPYYINRAHNDWLELVHSGGVPAAILLAIFLLWWANAARRLLSVEVRRSPVGRLGVAGLGITSILGLASLVDYPLRVPSLACLFVVGLVWISTGLGGPQNGGPTLGRVR